MRSWDSKPFFSKALFSNGSKFHGSSPSEVLQSPPVPGCLMVMVFDIVFRSFPKNRGGTLGGEKPGEL